METPEPLTVVGRRGWTLKVESKGRRDHCRLQHGDPRPVAEALARPNGSRARVRVLGGADRPEGRIAGEIAHRLCRVTGRPTVCGVDQLRGETTERAEIRALLHDAVARLEERSIRLGLVELDVLERIQSRADQLVPEIEGFLKTEVPMLEHTHRLVIAAARERHRRVRMFAPLYLSSACQNDCAYCGFRRGAAFTPEKLAREEALAEARLLAGEGHRTLDLVSGEVPHDPFLAYVADVVTDITTHTPIEWINLNLGTLSPTQYRRLAAAGARGYHLYQETYDVETYLALHRAGPKRRMAARLQAPFSILEAGFEKLGMGILLGLSPLTADLAALVAHAEVLLDAHPRCALGFSLPRIQPVDPGCGYRPTHPVSDDDFLRAVLFLRLRFPDAGITVTTRESPAMRDRLLCLGISALSAGVSTAPGGYHEPDRDAQFTITDRRTLSEVMAAVRAAGLDPVPA